MTKRLRSPAEVVRDDDPHVAEGSTSCAASVSADVGNSVPAVMPPGPRGGERRQKKPPPVVEAIPILAVLTTSAMLRTTRPLQTDPKIPPNKVGTLEMYKRFPQEYDLLMARHDCSMLSEVFGKLLEEQHAARRSSNCSAAAAGAGGVAYSGLRIADLGCGTGRLLCSAQREAQKRHIPLQLLCGYDKEAPMLRVAMANMLLAQSQQPEGKCVPVDRAEDMLAVILPPAAAAAAAPPVDGTATNGDTYICLRPFDFQHIRQGALASPHPTLHVAVCAWSLSYVMRACWGGERWHAELTDTVAAIISSVMDGGVVVIIETLGNGCETPTRKNVMMDFLEATFGFERQWVRTDYIFSSLLEGEAMCRFFFAQGVAEAFKERGNTTLPECTGVWVKHIRVGDGAKQ